MTWLSSKKRNPMHSLDELYRQLGTDEHTSRTMNKFFLLLSEMDADFAMRLIAQGITRAKLPVKSSVNSINLDEETSKELGINNGR
jgi:hypothetical protein